MTGDVLLREAASLTKNDVLRNYLREEDPKAMELAMILWEDLHKKDPKIPKNIAIYRVGETLCTELSLRLLKAKHNRRR